MKQLILQILVRISTVVTFCYLIGTTNDKEDTIPSFWKLVAIGILLQIFFFILSFLLKLQKYSDFYSTILFDVLGVACLLLRNGEASTNQFVGLGMMILWSTRIAFLLLYRTFKQSQNIQDESTYGVLQSISYLCLQIQWLVLIGAPVFLLVLKQKLIEQQLGIVQLLGIVIFAFGFVVEAISDHQKLQMKLDPKMKGKFIQHGLWRYSRHPNYCGDIILWIGICMFCLVNLQNNQRYSSLVSIVYTCILLIKINGINYLEQIADERWGKNVQYQQYKRNTPVLFPNLTNIFKLKSQ